MGWGSVSTCASCMWFKVSQARIHQSLVRCCLQTGLSGLWFLTAHDSSLIVQPPERTWAADVLCGLHQVPSLSRRQVIKPFGGFSYTRENNIALNYNPKQTRKIPSWQCEEYKSFNLPENSDKCPLANKVNLILIFH